MKVYGMALVRNEAGKWLDKWLYQMHKLCDKIIVLDDCSTDNTILKMQTPKTKIYQNTECLWETNEIIARKKLWNYTIQECKNEDWILCLDADELFDSNHLDYINWVFKHLYKYPIENIDGIGFKLFDMWNDTHYRQDNWWTAHFRYWCMAVRYNKNKIYTWSNKKLHCGRFPLNSSAKMNPTNIPIIHMGWSTEKLRKEKYERYMKIDGKNKNGLIGQYQSIMDNNPNLIEF